MTLKGLHSVPVFNFIIKFIKVNILKKLYILLFFIQYCFKKKIFTSFGSYSM